MDENQNQNHENRDYVAEAKALVEFYRDYRVHPYGLGIEPQHLEALCELIELRDEAIRTLLDETRTLVELCRDHRAHPHSLVIEPRHLEALWELIELRDEAIRTLLD